MNRLKQIWATTSYGQLSVALFVICLVSGIYLAIPFDVARPYQSISLIMIANPVASLFRNLHYWSAQLFLVFSLLHIYDHFGRKEGIRIKKAMWFRLSVGVLVIFLAMLTGFLLKGDADSLQAWRILDSLLAGIPLTGGLLSYSLLGTEGDMQLIYVHHIATFTIFIAILIFEHVRKFWPKWVELIAATLVTVLLSYYITAPLHDNLNPTVKGPWYFLGLQEILHWLTVPELSLLLIILMVTLIYLVPFLSRRYAFLTKRTLLIFTILYLFLTLTGQYLRGPNWDWIWPWEKDYSYKVLPQMKIAPLNFYPDFSPAAAASSPLIDGHKESCIICHDEVSGFTASHNPQVIGCFSCHGGNPFDSDKDQAHGEMLWLPGNLSDASRSCGTINCHPQITGRIPTGLMATLSGMISVDRFVFNEQATPDGLTDINHLGNSAADEHLRNLCVRCHLGNPKTEAGPINETSRGGGCLACHLNYDALAATAAYEKKWNKNDTSYLKHHSSVSLQVSDDHCFGCHSRSGRISTNYEGWHETLLEVSTMPDTGQFRIIEGTRVFRYLQDDVHHQLGMVCIDCHNSYELMGDGSFYAHQENQVNIQCTDCHITDAARVIEHEALDQESAIIAALRFDDISGKKFMLTEKKSRPLINTEYRDDTAFMISKNSGKIFAMKRPADICTRGNAHDALSCSACHTAWAPSCIGCHNAYEENEPGYNMITNTEKKGSWVEYVGEYNAHLPALGIRQNENEKSVIPVVPGMVLTIDVGSFDKSLHDSLIFQRLFAPAAPHTTRTKGRDCKSCHNNPTALGFGDGTLMLDETGNWVFAPKYQNNKHDGLPEDAWIGFLRTREGKVSTRSDVRPFSLEEQKRILEVGACLTCHPDDSEVMTRSLTDYDSLLKQLNPACMVPEF